MELISQLSQYDFVEISYLAKGSFATAYKCLDQEQQPNIILVIDSINECQNRLKMSDILKDVHNCHILKQLNNINLNSKVLIGRYYNIEMRDHMKTSSLSQKLDFFRELLVLVKQVHDKGVYHMDLKPSNIMVQDGKPVLIDFGQSVTEAEVDSVLNTSAYAPKHDVYSCNVIPEKFDIYCLGNMLHEIYIGQPLPAPINLLSRQYHQLQDKVGIIATHLISGMTCRDQTQRLTINQCIKHPLFAQQIQSSLENFSFEEIISKYEQDLDIPQVIKSAGNSDFFAGEGATFSYADIGNQCCTLGQTLNLYDFCGDMALSRIQSCDVSVEDQK
ncbi:Kinase [Hexamita inflata]|uniref:CAMK CAMKL n=1 Tax=Hexamita inflata TaxID=28002 RepID=A0AA86PIP6_9EUKA|nr:CAMK CAMKL [Hexamita inflata]